MKLRCKAMPAMMTARRVSQWFLAMALAAIVAAPLAARAAPPPQKPDKDYLTDTEADKIRDAFTYSEKIKLFVEFAGDRVQKIKYELAHLDPADRRQGERVNDLLNAYAGCVDDGDELIGVAVDKQQDVHEAMKIFDARAKEYLPYLQGLEPNAPLLEDYKDNL
ncbi:MAG: hypothetical protein WBF35_06820, partial [Candidatus Acidiferrales bacterium]